MRSWWACENGMG